MKHIRTIKHVNGRIEVKAVEYKTMSVFYYYGYLHNGHVVGYSKTQAIIEKRLSKAAIKK